MGQGGVNLSGGQKQRLIAGTAEIPENHPRHSTSAVDTATDNGAPSLPKPWDVTVIITATDQFDSMPDRILVWMMAGSTASTHDELMEQNEIYRDVFNSQQEGMKDQ